MCVEEPENQLYPKLLYELAEEFRAYADRGGQIFVSTHSPDFLNAVELDEVFCLVKKTDIRKSTGRGMMSSLKPLWGTAIRWVISGNRVFLKE